MRAGRTLAYVALMAGFASPVLAQSADSVVPPPFRLPDISAGTSEPSPDAQDTTARAAELQRWMDAFTEWLEWSAEWTNRREPGWFTSSRDRRQKPQPPEWLPARCATLLDDDDQLASACTLLAAWEDDEAGRPIRLPPAATAADVENRRRVTWWEHIHADLMWPAMQWQSSVYGVIGVHAATTVRGRFEVFLAPGAMLLNVPTRNGARVWKIAANYGIGYRLLDFRFPGGRPAALHVNLAKAWLLSDVADVVSGRTTDFVGLSISFKKDP